MTDSNTEDLQRLYSKIADKYTERYFGDLSDAPIIDSLVAQLSPNARVLDVGCGPGHFTAYLRSKGLAAEGIDMSPEMLAHAQKRVPEATFRQMDLRGLRYPDSVFGGVLAAYSLIHIASLEMKDALDELHRVLSANGLLLVIGQIGESDHIEDDPLAPGENVFVNFFSEERLRDYLEVSNFEVVDLAIKQSDDPTGMSKTVISALASAT